MEPHLTSSSSDNRAIAALQQEVDDFQLEWKGRACQLLAPNDRRELTRQVDELWQTLSATILRLSLFATAPNEIMEKIRHSLREGRAELDASLIRFQARQAHLERASARLAQKLENPSAIQFNPFVAPSLGRFRGNNVDHQRALLQVGMEAVNLLATIPRAIDKGISIIVENHCTSSETTRKICSLIAEGMQTTVEAIPREWRERFHKEVGKLHEGVIESFQREYQIPPDETVHFIANGELLLGSFLGFGAGKVLLNVGGRLTTRIQLKEPRELRSSNFILVEEKKPLILEQWTVYQKAGEESLSLAEVSALSNRTTVSFVHTLLNGAGETGVLFQTVERLREIALAQGSNRLIVEFVAANQQLLRIVAKRYTYLGRRVKLNDVGHVTSFIHQVEIPLHHRLHDIVHDSFKHVVPPSAPR